MQLVIFPSSGQAVGNIEREYDLKRRAQHIAKSGAAAKNYLFNVLEANRSRMLTSHVARIHSARDLRDFAKLREGESSAIAMRDRKVRFEFPYDKSCFKDRYTRQSRSQPCSTIVAHLSKDGLMFIHPTQTRSLTVREAARVQSFPDWFVFPESRTIAYHMIGNAVPPLVAEAVGNAVVGFLGDRAQLADVRCSTERDVLKSLVTFAGFPLPRLRAVGKEGFLAAWRALLRLFPELHPDNALDHGCALFSIAPVIASGCTFHDCPVSPISSCLDTTRSSWCTVASGTGICDAASPTIPKRASHSGVGSSGKCRA